MEMPIEDESLVKEKNHRNKVIIRTSIIGILANVFLSAFKAVIGLMTHSIAIVLDAVNNLSDAASSLITIIGNRLAGKKPDREHPFGHGRIEYLTAMVIAIIVMYAGLTSFIEALKKIVHPVLPDYNTTALILLVVGILVKIILGTYVKAQGRKVHSDSLIISGQDASLDAVISASTLAAAGLYLWKGISLEAFLAAVISIIILKSGLDMLKETLSKVLGERVDIEMVNAIKETVLSFPDVSGAYDLVLNNYGPDAFNGSLHIEVPDTYSACDLDELIREITIEVLKKHNVILTAIGVYSVNTRDDHSAHMRDRIQKEMLAHEHVLQMHGFYVNETKKTIRFDLVISFDAQDLQTVYQELYTKVQEMYPDYQIQMTMDTDFSVS